MTRVGTEGLGLFETVPERPPLCLTAKGRELRDAALAKASQGRQYAIQRVRDWLRQVRWIERGPYPDLTADDVHDALDALGLGEGDTRWSANIFRGWNMVTPTDKFVPSRRPSRHCAPTRVWRWA